MSEQLSIPKPPQTTTAALAELIGNGFMPIQGNANLEKTYFQYQTEQSQMLEQTTGLKFFKIEDLHPQEAAQVSNMVEILANVGIPKNLLEQRLERVRIAWKDAHTSEVYGDTGGEFMSQTGLAIVVRHDDTAVQNHHLLHEITHGLLVSGTLFEKDGRIISTGNGLHDARFASGEQPDSELLEKLRFVNEGIVDSFALLVSNLDDNAYLSGRLEGGYSTNINQMRALSSAKPELLYDMLQTAFVTGMQTTAQAITYTQEFSYH